MLLGVDVGGTFTDVVLAHGERLITAKVPSTPHDQSEGVLSGVARALEQVGATGQDVERFAHGTTVTTNALLEGKSARTALIATEGFTDLVELARQNRPELYRLCAARPAPFAGRELRFGAPERMTPDGPLQPLTPDRAGWLASQVRHAGAESVAVALLHSYRHPEHEQLVADALARELPEVHVSLSHEVVGTFREYERAATTEIDAALSPLLARYLRGLAERVREQGLPEPAIMQSNGGLIDLPSAASHAAWTVLSGPAGGAAGAAYLARACGERQVLCFDMGGTSCDVCVVLDGAVQEQSSGEIAGRPVALPMLAVHTVGAGGGSIAWRDPGGALRVGPQSAGADPGPACYGRGGTEPTVTDANLVLGRLGTDSPLAGGVELDREAAARAVGDLARRLDLDPVVCAEGILRVAVAEMVRALRVVTVNRGVDPRGFALMAFGGAGPLHATDIADELGMNKILCPRHSGVLAALGLVVSERRRDAQRTVLLSGDALADEAIGREADALGQTARQALGEPEARLDATYEMRYRGQSFELPIPGAPSESAAELRRRFEAAHAERYAFRDPEPEVELVTIRITATSSGADVTLDEGSRSGSGSDEVEQLERPVTIGGTKSEVSVLRGEPRPGTDIAGPAVVELPESTVLIAPGWSGAIDATGTVVLERTE
jgi:N-methylhydantoinase A